MAVTLNASNSGTGGLSVTSDATGNLAFQTAGTTAVTVDTSQNVGIGTSSPSEKLDVQSSADLKARIYTTGTTVSTHAGLIFKTGSYEYLIQNLTTTASSAGALRFYDITAGAERMRINSSGNLLVGTTSALSQTGIATFVGTGNGLVTQVGNSSTAYQSTNTSGTSAYYAAIFSNNGNTFSTCGTIQVSGTATSYNTSSDYRLKEDVQPMTGALAKVTRLKPVTYKWKSDGTESQGFIAHELAEICPQAVSGEKDALKEDGSIMPQGIDTSFLVATLTAAIQELKTINDTQAATITALTARIVALEK
jgi:hypothetical protein